MRSLDAFKARCNSLIDEAFMQRVVDLLGVAYEETHGYALDFPPELRRYAFGGRLWLEVQKQLASARLDGVVAGFGRVEANGFPYLTWTRGEDLLLTVKKVRSKNELVNESDYRRDCARELQPRLFDIPAAPEDLEGESKFGVILHGLGDGAGIGTEPSHVTIGFPSFDFTHYLHTIDVKGTLDADTMVPDLETGVKEEVLEWLARPKRRGNE